MRAFLKKILQKPVARLAERYSSKPDKKRVHDSLSQLYQNLEDNLGKRGEVISFNLETDRFIILSDQHKGIKNGSDDFAFAEKNYLAALEHYYQNNFFYINLGDSEELWENRLAEVKKKNKATFKKEKLFLARKTFIKVFGNHDLFWDNDPLASFELKKIYGEKLCVYEGAILKTVIGDKILKLFLTHGHQGDLMSDGNWFSKWFVSNIWGPLQSYLSLNPNTPAYDDHLKTTHNQIMYEWSTSRQNMLLVTGHTHQPVFESLTLFERLYQQLNVAKLHNDEKNILRLENEIKMKNMDRTSEPDLHDYKPSYFNSGCCCFNDGDITGIEISEGKIRLVKWEYTHDEPLRKVLEEVSLHKFLE